MQRKSIILRLGTIVFLAFWFLVPLPGPRGEGMLTIQADRGDTKNSSSEVYPFTCGRKSENITYRLSRDIRQGVMKIELLDSQDNRMMTHALGTGRETEELTFGFKGRLFLPGDQYRIRIIEENLAGSYRLEVSQQKSITWWQRYLVLFLALTAVGLILFFCSRGAAEKTMRKWSLRLIFTAGAFSTGLLYVFFHEMGHAIPMWFYGVLDFSFADIMGINGMPHVNYHPEPALSDSQAAFRSLAGPLLPIAIGYILFVFWISRPGKRLRDRAGYLDLFWSALITLFMFSSLGFLLPVAGLVRDGDYNGFVGHVQWPLWTANLLLIFIGVISLTIAFIMGRHLWPLLRQMKQYNK